MTRIHLHKVDTIIYNMSNFEWAVKYFTCPLLNEPQKLTSVLAIPILAVIAAVVLTDPASTEWPDSIKSFWRHNLVTQSRRIWSHFSTFWFPRHSTTQWCLEFRSLNSVVFSLKPFLCVSLKFNYKREITLRIWEESWEDQGLLLVHKMRPSRLF